MAPTDGAAGKSRYMVPGLRQGIEILRLFNSLQPTWTAPQIAAHFKWPRATVYRLLLTLESLGLTERSGDHAFKLGTGILSLGFAYLSGLDLVDIARPCLEGLRNETQCSVHLAVLDRGDALYVARYPGPGVITANIGIGTRLPAYALGLGRLLLLDMTVQDLRGLYGGGSFKRFTKETPAGIDSLAALLEQDRKRGFVVSRSLFAAGILAISAPIRDASGRVIGAISVTNLDGAVPQGRREDQIRNAVVRAARDISQRHGGGRPLATTAASRRPAAGSSRTRR
jgi:DNA-binding IclR family transcriptional regulator